MADHQKVQPEVAESLWARYRDTFTGAAKLFVESGFKADSSKGLSKKDVAALAWIELLQAAFKAGLDVGYDMGAHVFGQGPNA